MNTASDQPKKTALITGVCGQDGAYLAQLLLAKGYHVVGTSRDAHAARRESLERLGIAHQVQLRSMHPQDVRNVLPVITDVAPDEIYHLAGQSSVGLSFAQPADTVEGIVLGTLNILEAVRILDLPTRVFHAGSGESFGNTGDVGADEDTPLRPVSPYGVAKASAQMLVRNYRETYGLFAASGILFNHESPLRPPGFVTQKIVQSAARIAAGQQDSLTLGNVAVIRDWGWAPDYVGAMWRMMQADRPEDFVIATGEARPLEDFVALAFSFFNMDWRDHVTHDAALVRPNEIAASGGNPDKAWRMLGWRAESRLKDVVERMCESARELPL